MMVASVESDHGMRSAVKTWWSPPGESSGPAARVARTVLRLLELVVDVVFFLALLAVFGTVLANVITRTFLGFSLTWSSEISTLCVPIMAFTGGARAFGMDRTPAFTGLVDRFGPNARGAAAAAANVWVLLVALVIAVTDRVVVEQGTLQRSPILGITSNWSAIALQAAMALTALYALRNLWRARRRDLAWGVLAGAAIAALVYAAYWGVGTNASAGLSSAVALGTFVVAYLLGVPIIFVLLTSALLYVQVSHVSALAVIPSNMVSGVSGFIIVAVPFFVLAGTLLGEAGLMAPVSELISGLLAKVRGGLLHGTVVLMYLFSGVSGSKIADVAAVGTAMRKAVLTAGYRKEELAATLAASAVMGEAVPPSTVMLVLGSITTVSIGDLFKAGLLPAALLGVLLMVMIFLRASRRAKTEPAPVDAPRPPHGRELARKGVESIPGIVVPLVILVCIYTGIATPTEASSIAVALGVICLLATRTGRGKLSVGLLLPVEATAGFVLTVIGAATAFSFTLSVAGFPALISSLFTTLGGSRWSVLLLSVLLLPVLGMVLEGLPAILILGPLMMPIAQHVGINSLQYGVLLVLAIGLGTFAPPLGVGMFSTCAVSGTSVSKVSKYFWPYGIAIFAGLLILAFVPAVTTVVPQLLGSG
jgi:tripartite ATP-independent transporter DctM subunit